MEGVALVAFLVIMVLSFAALIYVGFPPRTGHRLKFKYNDGITIPNTCVITGKPATEAHEVRGFTGSPYHIQKTVIKMPFSQEGWQCFKKSYPASLSVFKGGLNILMHIPLLGPLFAIMLWTPFVGMICGLIAFIEAIFGKRQLMVPLGIKIKHDRLVAVDLAGVNEEFIIDFLQVNGDRTIDEYRTQRQKQQRIFWSLMALLLIMLIGYFVFIVIAVVWRG